jgi:hypothetical protein
MKVGKITGHPPDVHSYTEDSQTWLAPKLNLGLEIEIENPAKTVPNFDVLHPWWERQEDGSLRNNGFELVLGNPLFGKDLTEAVLAAERFVRGNEKLETNYRTGFHVHVDCRNMELAELERFFIIYALYERAIFEIAGQHRRNSNFCSPWGRISDHLESVFSIFDADASAETISLTLRNVDRYSALNCNALHKYGSLEFRHLEMTKDFDKIRNWINLIMSIYNACLIGSKYGPNYPVEDFIRVAEKGGAIEMARNIFPEWFIPHISDMYVWEGIMLVRDVLADLNVKSTFLAFGGIREVCPFAGMNPALTLFLDKWKES